PAGRAPSHAARARPAAAPKGPTSPDTVDAPEQASFVAVPAGRIRRRATPSPSESAQPPAGTDRANRDADAGAHPDPAPLLAAPPPLRPPAAFASRSVAGSGD